MRARDDDPVAGVDGTPSGWVVALLSGRTVRWALTGTGPADVLAATGDCAAVAVDVPMGLPTTGRRDCDQRARDRLGPARSSVFHAPPRAVLAAPGYQAACAVARELTGLAISKQLWGIADRIAAWDEVITPAAQDRVVEAHPECSFRALGEVDASKRTGRGVGQRLAALRDQTDLDTALAHLPPGPSVDDALDALAAACSARRWLRGEADLLGGDLDERGLAMRIVV